MDPKQIVHSDPDFPSVSREQAIIFLAEAGRTLLGRIT